MRITDFTKFAGESGIYTREKNFLNSICTPFGLFDCPQSLYLWAFPRFFKLFKLHFEILSYAVKSPILGQFKAI